MGIYSPALEEVLDKIKGYLEKGEKVRVSQNILYNEKIYRQLLLEKNTFKGVNTKFLYVDEQNEVVQNEEINKKLSRLAYFLNVFFNDESELSIKKALKKGEVKEREINDLDDVSESLAVLNKSGIQEAEKVKKITNDMKAIIQKHNEKVEEINLKADKIAEKSEVFSEEIISLLNPIYKEILLINFEKAKLLSQGKKEFDFIKNICSKKKMFSIFNKNSSAAYTKIIYTMEYFKRLISKYENAIHMDLKEYRTYIDEVEKDYINKRRALIKKSVT
ncbi:hypothetical protein [Clostridium ganghwense]|uniref:Uncharacterized protein n=1 Tax=Clostridium ganghwense TaxID=312089 RepID=A0ABT4CN86_9CLOT|nr:hypothetical protein [Clostridium ganghwense]MCY6370520.1 hypothetical protein [Clostridium ganghwense]